MKPSFLNAVSFCQRRSGNAMIHDGNSEAIVCQVKDILCFRCTTRYDVSISTHRMGDIMNRWGSGKELRHGTTSDAWTVACVTD